MKACILTLFGMVLCTAAFGQQTSPPTISLEELGGYFPFNQGMRISIYDPATSRSRTFILGDTTAYLINQKDFRRSIFYRMKARELDSLIVLKNLKIANLEAQRDLMTGQLETEQKAFGELQRVSDLKDQIAQDSIDKLRQFRRKSLLLGTFMGVVGGLLWVKDSDSSVLQIGKPVAVGGAGFFLSFTMFK